MADVPFRNRAFVCGQRRKRSFNAELISTDRERKWGGKAQPFGRVINDAQRPSQPISVEPAPPAPGHTHKTAEGPFHPAQAMPAPSLPEPDVPPCATGHPLPPTETGHHPEIYMPPKPEAEAHPATTHGRYCAPHKAEIAQMGRAEVEQHLLLMTGKKGMAKPRAALKARLRKLVPPDRKTQKRTLIPGKDRP
ncbi:hypothetical protein [Tateyamaria sp.]|uniref:hypothetical protein n=1 Tax=Tateyamaria sp. TaxID=1929288 RepID=UPI0032A14587